MLEHFGHPCRLPAPNIVGFCEGCGEEIYDYDLAQCEGCGGWFHKDCLDKDFKSFCIGCGVDMRKEMALDSEAEDGN